MLESFYRTVYIGTRAGGAVCTFSALLFAVACGQFQLHYRRQNASNIRCTCLPHNMLIMLLENIY